VWIIHQGLLLRIRKHENLNLLSSISLKYGSLGAILITRFGATVIFLPWLVAI